MNLEALYQNLLSYNINPDKNEDERYANAFRISFAIIEILSEENVTQNAEIQMLRGEINLLKGEKPNPIFVVLKRTMISLLKVKGNKGHLKKTGKLIQEKTNWKSTRQKPAKLIGLLYLKMLFLKVIVP